MTSKSMGVPEPTGGPTTGAGRLRARQEQIKDVKLERAAQEFEAFFVSTLLKQMRKAIPQEGLLHSRGEEIFRDLMDDQIGQDIARGRGFGLADTLYRQLSLDEGRPGR